VTSLDQQRVAPPPYPGEAVFDAEHPVKHVFFETPGATRLAVVFSGFERAHQPKYNYIERFRPLACHRLHVLDDLGSRGCYYLGRDRDFFVARDIATLVDQKLEAVGLSRGDVVTVGSSKGATAAIYHALAFGYGEAIAAAPQVLVGKYLTETVSARDVSGLIAGGHMPQDVEFLNTFMFDTVERSPYRPKLEFFISRDDSHFEIHLQPLLAALDAKQHPYDVVFGEYTPHSAVGVPFSRHVLKRLGAGAAGVRMQTADPSHADVVHVDPASPEPSEDLERYLYRSGYVIHEARGGPEPRAEDLARRMATWSEVRVGRYALRFDRTWVCSHAQAGDVEVALLGTATHVDDPSLSHERIVSSLAAALARSQERFYDLVDHLSGAHILLVRVGHRHFVLQDATGMETAYYDIIGREPLVSSHPGLIAELHGYDVSEFGRWWLAHPGLQAGGAYFPGLLTPYEEIRILTPNTQLDLDSARVERFYPRMALGTRDLDEIVEEVARRLRNQWQWLTANHNHEVSVSLTAGLDSRLTLTASRDVAPDLHYFTYTVWGNRSHRIDCEVASEIAERFGLRHEVYRIKRGEPVPDCLTEYWDRMYGGQRGGLVLANAYLSRYPEGNLHVRSNVLETVRGFYLKNRSNIPDRFDPAKLSRLFRGITASEFVPQFEEFARITSFNSSTKLDYHFSDLYYWEHRLGAWHSGVVSRSKTSHETFIIYNCRKVLEAMLALPLAERVKAIQVWELMGSLWPEAIEIPVVVMGEPTSRPQRLA
jgi:hypothetical protein